MSSLLHMLRGEDQVMDTLFLKVIFCSSSNGKNTGGFLFGFPLSTWKFPASLSSTHCCRTVPQFQAQGSTWDVHPGGWESASIDCCSFDIFVLCELTSISGWRVTTAEPEGGELSAQAAVEVDAISNLVVVVIGAEPERYTSDTGGTDLGTVEGARRVQKSRINLLII